MGGIARDRVTGEGIPHSTEGYAKILTNPPTDWYNEADPEISSFKYNVTEDEYLEGYDYQGFGTRGVVDPEGRIKTALEKYGILYIHANWPYTNMPGHSIVLIGYNDTASGTDFWYHDTYNGEDFSEFSRYGTIPIEEINYAWAFYDRQWSTFQHDNRRTGLSITVGDVTKDDHKVTWNSSGDQSTDFWDGPVIADIDGGKGLELIVGTENYEGTDGRVYALDGDTDNQLWITICEYHE